MKPETPSQPNAAQAEYWNGKVGGIWAEWPGRLDAVFAGLAEDAIFSAAPVSGEHVLDIGCGAGATVLALARRVGEAGSVLGVDISAVLLEVARRRAEAQGLVNVELLVADAATHPFAPARFDLAFSRFGVMFFADPGEAFRNIHGALKPGGRLCFVCWGALSENPFFDLPGRAVAPYVPPKAPADPHAPGPLAFADPGRVRRILADAGFRSIAVEPQEAVLPLSASGKLEDAVRLLCTIGPAARALAEAEPSAHAPAQEAVRAALAAIDGPDGVNLPARLWMVSARA